jgi:hypothetical protein
VGGCQHLSHAASILRFSGNILFEAMRPILDPPSRKLKTSLILIKQGDRVFVEAKTIINEVK